MLRPTKAVPKARRRWVAITLAGARFHNVNFAGARFTGVELEDVSIDGYLGNLTVNGVQVAPLISAELDRQFPERRLLSSDRPEDLRASWEHLTKTWAVTTERAQGLGPAALERSVANEWSFVQTLRHLVMATDAWIGRTALGQPDPFWPAGLATDDLPSWYQQACGLDPKAKPTTHEVLAARAQRQAVVGELIDSVVAGKVHLSQNCPRNKTKAYPGKPEQYSIGRCLGIILKEEWEHHRFAVRDLGTIACEEPPQPPATSATAGRR